MRDTMLSFEESNALTLKLMGDGLARQVNQIKDSVTDLARLSPEVLNEKLPSGESRARHRVGWACSNLYRAGFLHKPQRGVYQISDTGREILPRVGQVLTEKDFESQPRWQQYLTERDQRQSQRGHSTKQKRQPDLNDDPESIAITAVDKLNDDLSIELLRRLREGSPAFFERAVIKVLRAMGYGGRDERELASLLTQSHTYTGRSGDGGIDGIIKLDPLGIQNIYVQAKRYGEGNPVGRPEVQGFVGALHGKRANRGVFITTSRYTPDARAYAEAEAQDRLVLIDGVQLTDLMRSYGVGVQPKQTLTLLEIDEDFFE